MSPRKPYPTRGINRTDEAAMNSNARLIAAAPQLKDAAEYLLETLGAAHMKCDEQSDTACYGEQYGDANAGEHAYYRELSALLARIEGRP